MTKTNTEILDAYSVCKNGLIPPEMKMPVIAGHSGSTFFPLVYLKKPKSISQETFDKILNGLKLHLPIGFQIKFE